MLGRIARRYLKTSAITRCDRSEIVRDLLQKSATFQDGKAAINSDEWSTLPYPEGAVITNEKENIAEQSRPQINPADCSIIVFPGQGAQFVGMGKDLQKFPAARDIYALASEVLKYDILKLCLEGPDDKLNSTAYCQPAIMVTCLAALEKLKEERPNSIENCVATAGFSLGEITALVFAGALPFDKALKLVRVRGEAMQMASDANPGGLATVLYSPNTKLGVLCHKAKEWCIEKGVENPQCQVVNYLFPQCKVIGGSIEALKYLEANAKQYSIKRIKRLPVSGAFHTPHMDLAIEPFRKALKSIAIEDPIISVYSNVDGKRYRNASHIFRQLPKQIVAPVKWEQILHGIYERKQGTDFPRTFECGPGKGLTAILKQVNAKAWDSAVSIEV